MSLLNNPVTIAVLRSSGRLEMLDVIPVYVEQQHAFVATDALRIYEGFPRDEADETGGGTNLDRYLQYLDSFDADSPFFLGELHIRKKGLPCWQYYGSRLTENEIGQLVEAIMAFTDQHVQEEAAIYSILKEKDNLPDELAFVYSNGLKTDFVRVQEMEGQFIILINEEVVAQIEMHDESWEIAAGKIDDSGLLTEIINRINASAP